MIQIWNLKNSIHILTLKSSMTFKLKLSEIKLNEIHINDMVWRYSWRSEILGMRRIHSIHIYIIYICSLRFPRMGSMLLEIFPVSLKPTRRYRKNLYIYVYLHQAEDNLIDFSLWILTKYTCCYDCNFFRDIIFAWSLSASTP